MKVSRIRTSLRFTLSLTMMTLCSAQAQDGSLEARTEILVAAAANAKTALQARGEYLAQAGDCISCHTRPGGAPFAGGLALKTPFGTVVSTNITPDKSEGIGNYTLHNFDQALRHGLDAEGGNLYPAMPYVNYAKLSDDDLGALFAYFMEAVPPARQENAQSNMRWPFNMKWLIKGWNFLYLPKSPYIDDNTKDIQWNRGAYLVQGLGHCGACHTPRSFTGAEKASTEKDGPKYLSGAVLNDWYAQPLRRNSNAQGAEQQSFDAWTVIDMVDYLKTGRNLHTAAFGPMSEVVSNSTQYFTTDDLIAVAVYLISLRQSGKAVAAENFPAKKAEPLMPLHPTTIALKTGVVSQTGAMVYLNNCSGCHRSNGRGDSRTFPALAGSSSVAASDPTSLIRIIIEGSAMPHTIQSPSQLAMPPLGWRLSDKNIADVLNFVRNSWGNQGEPIAAQAVAKVRLKLTVSTGG